MFFICKVTESVQRWQTRGNVKFILSSQFMNLSAVNSLFGCFLFEARGRFCSGFFCTDVVVYMDTVPSFCERHTDVETQMWLEHRRVGGAWRFPKKLTVGMRAPAVRRLVCVVRFIDPPVLPPAGILFDKKNKLINAWCLENTNTKCQYN